MNRLNFLGLSSQGRCSSPPTNVVASSGLAPTVSTAETMDLDTELQMGSQKSRIEGENRLHHPPSWIFDIISIALMQPHDLSSVLHASLALLEFSGKCWMIRE